MRNVRRFVAIILVLSLPAVLAAESLVTVGQFVQRIAVAKGIPAADAGTAIDGLRSAGIPLPSDIVTTKSLTRGDVVVIAQAVGVHVTTTEPEAGFGAAEVERFLKSFSSALGVRSAGGNGPGTGESGPPFDPFSKAKGKGSTKAKFNRTPSE